MLIEKDKVYCFTPRKGVDTSMGLKWIDSDKCLVYLRKVGKTHLFQSAVGRWLEGFTREQLRDYIITEQRI